MIKLLTEDLDKIFSLLKSLYFLHKKMIKLIKKNKFFFEGLKLIKLLSEDLVGDIVKLAQRVVIHSCGGGLSYSNYMLCLSYFLHQTHSIFSNI